MQRIQNRQIALARNAEGTVDTVHTQRIDQHLTAATFTFGLIIHVLFSIRPGGQMTESSRNGLLSITR
ncbi:hypothetical protein D3C84_1092380 [compost metagenome]